ncbi:sensor histidine kinase [Paenibacillus prosopidis]|uniref:Two-component system sensor histidine kinase YesM n=1 Tax=Paenibacillus prosopidis TaxID=630520 RepID=A0A368W1D4_9BACL|nr:histidine kinase [Paenibacillus prosopidis]RCW47496.1 two-component system sensor histidine kinase YesM [Paenibacillus prosopidis]
MGGLSRLSWNSIRFKLVVGLLLITLPTVAFLIYNNLYAIRVVHNQVAESNRNLMSMYMGQVDNNLNEVDKYLTNLIVNDKDLQEMAYSSSEENRILAKVRLDNKIRGDIATFQSVNSLFVYSIPGQDYFEAFQDFESVQQRDEVRGYIRVLLNELQNEGELQNRQWYVHQIGQGYYLFRVLQTSDAYIGAWVNIEKLSIPLNLLDLGEKGLSLFSTDNGTPMTHADAVREYGIDLNRDLQQYYLSGKTNSFLVVGERSAKGNFSLIAIIPDERTLENLPYLRRIAYAIPIAAIILVPACLLLLRKMVLRPLKRILAAMKRIGEGSLNTRIEPFPTSDEFHLVNETFNQMMKQVQELRIHVYEEQLSKQKAELQHLQLQINPHFFMNSLNIIYNLALVRNYELIQEMSLSLVQYFRYMFRSNLAFVPLKEELKHVRNYVRIQELRFPGLLEFQQSAPDYLMDTRIPPLIIQTFVENSIKHAATPNDSIRISVRIDLDDSGAEPRILIEIKDNGKGFRNDILEEIQAGNRIEDEQGEHIGIWNVKRRIRLLYADEADLFISNALPAGAMVMLLLPLQSES